MKITKLLLSDTTVKIPKLVFLFFVLAPFIAYADAFLFYNQNYVGRYFIMSVLEISIFTMGLIIGKRLK